MRRFRVLARHLGMGQRRSSVWLKLVVISSLLLAACTRLDRAKSPLDARKSPLEVVKSATRNELVAFESEAELEEFLRALARARRVAQSRFKSGAAAGAKLSCIPATCGSLGVSCGVHPNGCGGHINCGSCASGDEESEAPAAEAAPEAAAPDAPSESVTNVQHAGVDEGGIVKLRGRHLIVLRRGRLFTIEVGDGALKPVSSVEAFAPSIDPSDTWYDEMLVSDSTIVVIGYSYARGGTELGIFDIDAKGKLAYRATYHLRSNDYYSSRNYASRLIGKKLVFYTPLSLVVDEDDPYASFPAIRKWKAGARGRDFQRIAAARQVYRPIAPSTSLTLHSVSVCDLETPDLACKSEVVIGPPGRVFYVSPESVYVWVTDGERSDKSLPDSLVYRMPLDGSAPSVLRASGSPVDQFSFLDDGKHLNVLLRAEASGDGMWSAEIAAGDVALMSVPLDEFSTTPKRAPGESYTRLPKPKGYTFQNRFVGEHVIYGSGNGWGRPEEARHGTAFVYRFRSKSEAARLALEHSVDRIEALGTDAIVIGSDGQDLHFSPLALKGRPWVAPSYRRKAASQGELRSHGFFYRQEGDRSGLFGLPIREPGRPGYEHLFYDSASVLYVQNRGLVLKELGTLAAQPEGAVDDGCRASCVDWYGNARPLFVQNRVFALLGYEVVEGELTRGRIREKRRVTFAPRRD